ncbi:hypothetical protein QQP08_027405 [Theobroma cacao]|nr:hypothetical protein QQP08_027405 [Theobroma cacao]
MLWPSGLTVSCVVTAVEVNRGNYVAYGITGFRQLKYIAAQLLVLQRLQVTTGIQSLLLMDYRLLLFFEQLRPMPPSPLSGC